MSGARSSGFRLGGTSLAAALCLLLVAGLASASGGDPGGGGPFTPGAAGAGDPYFPLDGNGGYDAQHYELDLRYNPATDTIGGTARIEIRATQNLSRFNLDLEGLTVHAIEVDRRPAAWTREGGELVITPQRGIRDRQKVAVEIGYSGVPETIVDLFGTSGFIHTDDGAVIIGQPHVADTWYPVNDHPIDKASYRFDITVPDGLEVVANGELRGTRSSGGWTTWTWVAKEPMASYLTTATIGEFELREYVHGDTWFLDAVDPDLYGPTGAPRTGTQFAISQQSEPSYKRLQRTIAVPPAGATLSFWIDRQTEPQWDFVFVEAHTPGEDDWTTLPDLNGHTSDNTGFVCPFWLGLHPFLEHYQSDDDGDGACEPTGDTGDWNAASGESGGYEQWRVDLGPWATAGSVEVSITYASDDLVQLPGAFVDDIVVSTGEGSTSFEADGNTMDGWTVPGAPDGSAPNPNDWIVGTQADTPENVGPVVDLAFGLQGEILDFEETTFGRYPFSALGGIVDDTAVFGFALENQTRPIYSKGFFFDPGGAVDVVVHEIAHQWFGDSLAVARWQHIWLNEGFATYAEWLWSEDQGGPTAQEIFDFFHGEIPDDDPFWQLVIGDPGPDHLFDFPVYARGAMTLHQLRVAVGDKDFFRILERWASTRRGDNVTTDEFIAHAEKISREQLDDLFHTWLFTPGKPAVEASTATATAARAAGTSTAALRAKLKRLHEKR
jgi:hypothetical protein